MVCTLVRLERMDAHRTTYVIVCVAIDQNKMVLERYPSDNGIIRGSCHWLPTDDITQESSGTRDKQTESLSAALCWQGCFLCKNGKTLYTSGLYNKKPNLF